MSTSAMRKTWSAPASSAGYIDLPLPLQTQAQACPPDVPVSMLRERPEPYIDLPAPWRYAQFHHDR